MYAYLLPCLHDMLIKHRDNFSFIFIRPYVRHSVFLKRVLCDSLFLITSFYFSPPFLLHILSALPSLLSLVLFPLVFLLLSFLLTTALLFHLSLFLFILFYSSTAHPSYSCPPTSPSSNSSLSLFNFSLFFLLQSCS